MTRDEFMEEIKKEVNNVLIQQRDSMMALIDKAYRAGEVAAETEAIESKANDILERLKKKLEEESPNVYVEPPNIGQIPAPAWHGSWAEEEAKKWGPYPTDGIPAACRSCPNHPSNGGSGICHCIIGTQPIMCNSTANDICDAIEKDKMSFFETANGRSIAQAIGNSRDCEVYNACCDNHIKIIHDMMTGASQISVDTKGSISSDSN